MIPFLDRYAHPFQGARHRAAERTRRADAFYALTNAGECTDWIARSIGLGGAAGLEHADFNRTIGDRNHG